MAEKQQEIEERQEAAQAPSEDKDGVAATDGATDGGADGAPAAHNGQPAPESREERREKDKEEKARAKEERKAEKARAKEEPKAPEPAPELQADFRRVGHQGADLIVEGNTIESFEAAVEAGAEIVEFDVLRTRD